MLKKVDGGYLSDSFVVGSSGKQYLLKQYREKYNEQDLINIHKTKQIFSENGIPIIMPLENNQQKTYFKHGNYFYSLFPFVNAKSIKPDKVSDRAVRSMAKMQAKMHKISFSRKIPKIFDRETNLWNKEKALEKGERIKFIIGKRKLKDNFDKIASKFVDFKIANIKKNKIIPEDINLKSDCLIHGDYHAFNLFFDDNYEVKYVFDLEKTVYAPRAYELVRAIDYICLNDFNFKKAGLYIRAYRDVYPISEEEFEKGFVFYLMKGIHTFWIEENHYLDNNFRTDVFYKDDNSKTNYYAKHSNSVIKKIVSYSNK